MNSGLDNDSQTSRLLPQPYPNPTLTLDHNYITLEPVITSKRISRVDHPSDGLKWTIVLPGDAGCCYYSMHYSILQSTILMQ